MAKTPWVDFLAKDPAIRSNTSVCLKVVDPRDHLADGRRPGRVRQEARGAAGEGRRRATTSPIYRDAPPGLRIWCGATVETSDVEALTPWLDWAFAEAKAALPKAA